MLDMESHERIHRAARALAEVILGKDHQVRLALACLLSRGHLLLEDLPGMGKTTFAHALAAVLGLQYQRVQFTSDMLPADILGTRIFQRDSNRFVLHKGPVFSQLLLADEINRSSPKTQSALLEAMEEHQVTIDGETVALPEPFFVIATQNPVDQSGTYPLPESQLDRFLLCISLGYPERAVERRLLQGQSPREQLKSLPALLTPAQLADCQQAIRTVQASDAVLDYALRLIECTRNAGVFVCGLSPRAGLGLMSVARAWAFIDGRSHVLPEDLQVVFAAVADHRLHYAVRGEHTQKLPSRFVLDAVDVLG